MEQEIFGDTFQKVFSQVENDHPKATEAMLQRGGFADLPAVDGMSHLAAQLIALKVEISSLQNKASELDMRLGDLEQAQDLG